ncbi:MAG: type 1 glutamine amidotransferase [Proteobacteria bacterium]|nr:type 1 glutamine amidotransferase [Pseudomonadota bacterium]
MSKQFLVFQHMPWEGPGEYLIRSAKKFDVSLHIAEVWHRPIPDISSYDGLIILGGSPNIDQEDKYPFLKAEKEAIRRALELDMSYLGFCLGHQLLADALGAKVGTNFRHSVGFVEGRLTKSGLEHPLFRGIPGSFPLFKWHSQAVLQPFPKEVEILATSADCEVEAISVKGRPHLVGLQFDNQSADYEDVREWLEADRDWLSSLPQARIDPTSILADVRRLEDIMKDQFGTIFRNYMNIVSSISSSR